MSSDQQSPTVPAGRKIALIGKAPSSALLAPYDDQSWEVWILNTLGSAKEVPRWDRQFELHDLEIAKRNPGDYVVWLSQQTKPVYLRDDPPEGWQGGVRYPLAAILETFKDYSGRNYLTNTVSMMIALALYEHTQGQTVTNIGLWGIDMAQHGMAAGGGNGWFSSEYARQRPSVEYWVALAEGKGITITIPPQSDLLKTACIYGYQHTDGFIKFEQRRKELQQRIGMAQQKEQQSHDEAVFLSGALESAGYYEQWISGEIVQ